MSTRSTSSVFLTGLSVSLLALAACSANTAATVDGSLNTDGFDAAMEASSESTTATSSEAVVDESASSSVEATEGATVSAAVEVQLGE